MRAMPKTLDTQGFSGLREEVVRSEGRPSCSPVLQALIFQNFRNKEHLYSVQKIPSAIFSRGIFCCVFWNFAIFVLWLFKTADEGTKDETQFFHWCSSCNSLYLHWLKLCFSITTYIAISERWYWVSVCSLPAWISRMSAFQKWLWTLEESARCLFSSFIALCVIRYIRWFRKHLGYICGSVRCLFFVYPVCWALGLLLHGTGWTIDTE